jgi:isoleucyl-tRNA synthetase
MPQFPELLRDDQLEPEVLRRWSEHGIPGRCLTHNAGGKPFVFFEGPPTANGRPGLHHVFSRTIKDTVCRYRLMKGYHVPRRAGWDTQGLPVEIEVQKQLAISTRTELLKLGIEKFNQLCRASVFKYVGEWEAMSRRMGNWLDYEHPYVTMDPAYIESLWALLSNFHGRGLLQKDYKILPYCPRCSTGLSNHEVAQGYAMVQDPSVYVRFVLDPDSRERLLTAAGVTPGDERVSLLVWTTTPWTLFSNVAVAAHPDLAYALVRREGEILVMAAARVKPVLGEGADVLGEVRGSALVGLGYERPLTEMPLPEGARGASVSGAEFVASDDGTGLVHIAPAYGADDFQLRKREGLPLVHAVDDEGRFFASIGPRFAGRWVKEADPDIMKYLKDKGLLFRHETIDHSYPHCWRCDSPLLYMARPSWYLSTTKYKDRMVALNATIDWHPPELGSGRFGAWLANNVDWAISRERYWGTPLNIWVCDTCKTEVSPASFEALAALAPAVDPATLDPHRPMIDEVTFRCAKEGCSGTLRRTPEVIDCWFDSGAMPFAQAGWPKKTGGALPAYFPADFISEGVDQTRGWFYTLHAISTLLTAGDPATPGGSAAFKTCVVNDLLLDAKGKKMSKSRGNAVDPMEVFATAGADAARWYFLSSGHVWLPKNFDFEALKDAAYRTFGTLKHCYAFLALYANLDGFQPGVGVPAADRPAIDRWLLSRLQSVTGAVDRAYERYDLNEVTRVLASFIDEELSNWYVRRNRSRFWKSGDDLDKRAAFATLHAALERMTLLLAPMVPFVSDWLWLALTGKGPGDSVHLAPFPQVDPSLIDADLEADMDVVLDAVKLGRTVRALHSPKVRQPLSKCLIKPVRPADAERLRRPELSQLVASELNVRKVEVVDRTEFRSLSAKPNFKRLGKRLGGLVKKVAGALAALPPETLEKIEAGEAVTLTIDGTEVRLERDDIEIQVRGRDEYAVASDGRLVLALDTTLDPDLLREGIAREVIHRVQNARKTAGLEIQNRIHLHLAGAPDALEAVKYHREMVLNEVLGVGLDLHKAADDGLEWQSADMNGQAFSIAVVKAETPG